MEGFSRRRAAVVAAWTVAVLAFFANSWSNSFVSDDFEFLGRIHLANAFQYFWKSWGYGNEYRPLVPLSYALDALWSGASPVGYHITNTLLHVGNALLLAWIVIRMKQARLRGALLVASLFALNPVAHEAVLWISGRPVLLGVFFSMLAIAAFLAAEDDAPPAARAASYGFFLLGLLSYEGAAAAPLLLAILAASRKWLGLPDRPGAHRRVLGYFALLAAYIAAWNLFFAFRITRFPVQATLGGGLACLGKAALQSWHGSTRLVPAAVYLALLAALAANRDKRALLAVCLAIFAAAYAPFLMVRGYADRFAYFSSMAAAALLAAALAAIPWPRVAMILPAAFLLYFGVGLQHRIGMWKVAGEIAGRIPAEVKRLRPVLPAGAHLIITSVPDMHVHALVFLTGLERAIGRQYPGVPLVVSRTGELTGPGCAFAYDGAHVREVGCVLP